MEGERPFFVFMYMDRLNTIRKRIDRIMEDDAFTDVNWNNTVERVKMILLLQYLEAGE